MAIGVYLHIGGIMGESVDGKQRNWGDSADITR